MYFVLLFFKPYLRFKKEIILMFIAGIKLSPLKFYLLLCAI